MTPERYEQIGRLYQAAGREPSGRAAFSPKLAARMKRCAVASLVAAHEQASNFIEQPPDDVAGWQAAAMPLQGRSFAHYQMLSLLGRGG
jgi:hypothetical protein